MNQNVVVMVLADCIDSRFGGGIVAVSEDLRIRLVRKVASGMSRRQAAALFEVSASSAVRYVRRYEDEGTVAVKPRPSRKRRLDPYGEDILRWIKETSDLTLQELSERLDEVHEVIAPTSTINDWFRARKISFKKTAHASEQERADVQAARVVWRKRQAWLLAHPERVGRIVFLDETSINTKMARLRGRCPRGQRDGCRHSPWSLENHDLHCRIAL